MACPNSGAMGRIVRLPGPVGVVPKDAVLKPVLSVTTTGPGKRTILPIAPLLGQATRRLLARKPLSPLLERWPVSFEE